MNYQKTTEEIADVYIKRIVEQNKKQYSESYELGKKNIYHELAHRDACIYRLQEIIGNNKSSNQNHLFSSTKNENNLHTKYYEDWTWVSKIIYVLLEKNAPLRSKQMIEFFIPIDGVNREFWVHVPIGYKPNVPTPVLIMLHGTSGNGLKFYEESGWKEVGDEENIITVLFDNPAGRLIMRMQTAS